MSEELMMKNSHSVGDEFESLMKEEEMERVWRLEKLEGDEEIEEMQSGEYGRLWELLVADQLEEGEFMVSSPVRKPVAEAEAEAMQNGLSVMMVCSPPRIMMGPYYKDKKQSGLSPLHMLLNSEYYCMQVVEESLSLPPLEFLDHDHFGTPNSCSNPNNALEEVETISSSDDFFDLSSVPELLECFPTMPNPNPIPGGSNSQLTQANDVDVRYTTGTGSIYQMSSSTQSAPLQQENQQLQMQQQESSISHPTNHQLQINMNSSLISIGPEQEEDRGLGVVHLLLACAEAVAKEDYTSGRRYLHHLDGVVSPLGDSMQRVASCFAQALGARLLGPASSSKPLLPFPQTTNSVHEILNIYHILCQACPYIKSAHFKANQVIFEAFEAQDRVHIIDLDILQGYQWPVFMQALAARPGGAPFVRITGVGPSPESVSETGQCLKQLARSLHIPFEFHGVGEQQLQHLTPHVLFNMRRVGKTLAVNAVNRLHRVPARFLGNLLAMIRDQAPNIVTVVEQEASHNGAHFLGRFLEALHYYSAIFDSLAATFPRDSEQRMKVEQYIFGAEIRNIVAAEGPERVMRHERLAKWRKIMEGKGFKGVPLSQNAVNHSKILLGLYSCEGYRLTEDKGCLLLGWQDRPILAASAWRYWSLLIRIFTCTHI